MSIFLLLFVLLLGVVSSDQSSDLTGKDGQQQMMLTTQNKAGLFPEDSLNYIPMALRARHLRASNAQGPARLKAYIQGLEKIDI